jgi:hypothetical protein
LVGGAESHVDIAIARRNKRGVLGAFRVDMDNIARG